MRSALIFAVCSCVIAISLATDSLRQEELSSVEEKATDIKLQAGATGYVGVAYYTDSACASAPVYVNAEFASGVCMPSSDIVTDSVSNYAIYNFDPTQTCAPTAVYTVTYYSDSACTTVTVKLASYPISTLFSQTATCANSNGLTLDLTGTKYGYGKLICSASNFANTVPAPNYYGTYYSFAGSKLTCGSNPYYYTAVTANCMAFNGQSAQMLPITANGVTTVFLYTFSGTTCGSINTGLPTLTFFIQGTCTQGILGGGYIFNYNGVSSSSSSSSTCFAGSNIVTLENGSTKLISEVAVGDRVLTYSTKTNSNVFSNVVALPHGANNKLAEFFIISTVSGKQVKLTAEHLIEGGNCGQVSLVSAKSIKEGQCVLTIDGEEKVVDIVMTREEGLYSMVTEEELVVVGGVVASPFAMNHFVPNIFYNVHRFLFAVMPKMLSTKIMDSVSIVADEIAQYYTVGSDSL